MPSETSTRAFGRPLPVFMSWAKTRSCSRDDLTIASRSEPTTRVVAWRCFSSVTFTTQMPGAFTFRSYAVSTGLYLAYFGTGTVHSASAATRPMSSDSTLLRSCFLRKYASALSL